MQTLVRDLVRLLLPGPESRESLFVHQLNHRDPALGKRLRELAVDERIVEADARSVGGQVAKVHTSQVRPIDGAQAHGAWLARGVNLAILKNESAEFGAGLANGDDLRVGGWIVGRGHAIHTFRDDDAIFDDHGAERSALAGEDIVEGELDSSGHKSVVHVRLDEWVNVNCAMIFISRVRANPATWTLSQPFVPKGSISRKSESGKSVACAGHGPSADLKRNPLPDRLLPPGS